MSIERDKNGDMIIRVPFFVGYRAINCGKKTGILSPDFIFFYKPKAKFQNEKPDPIFCFKDRIS